MEQILFTLANAARLLQIEVRALRTILRISCISTNYAVNGQIGTETLRVLHRRLHQTATPRNEQRPPGPWPW